MHMKSEVLEYYRQPEKITDLKNMNRSSSGFQMNQM